VKLMTGSLEPTEGEIKRNAKVRIAIVNQHHADQLNLEMTPIEFMKHKVSARRSARDHCAR